MHAEPIGLVSKDRHEEALQILIKYHAEGDASAELPHLELAEIQAALKIENESRARGWGELFQTKGMRHRSLVAAALGLFVQFSGNNLISQYFVPIAEKIGITSSYDQVRYNVGKESWGFLVSLIMASVTPRFPRRRMFLLCASCLLAVYTAWTIAQARNRITGSKESGYAVLVFIFLYSPAYCIGYNALTYVYMVEMFPYYVRTKGLSWFQLFGRTAVMFGSFVNPIGLENIDWKYLIVYVVWLCFEIVFIYFFFPETYGKTLEELHFLFESEKDERDALAAAASKVINDPSVVELHEVPEKKV
ncbi:hypothetical protein B5807_00136 [Epicoccum nigrum]|uniref:Major facilitator superfamily (MFS) profile domain-containing protein n=1 Tax=Epicoccum nigrum TaxID=105696 RepID=A0A1Y2MFC3_EPING|nr:hypothetical protein B5807_00136 [Epicoccum nigrum]